MNRKKIILRSAAVFGIVIVVAFIGGYFYLRSSGFKQFALRKIIEQVNESTGGNASIRDLDFQLSSLTAHVYNIVIHGKESPTDPPLLAVDKLTVSLKIQSVFRRQVYLSELLVEHPVVHVQVDSQENSNLPQPKETGSSSGSPTSVFDLGVRHAAITNGEIAYNDREIPLDADLRDLRTDVSFDYLARRYTGSIAYRDGSLHYANYQPVPHSFEAAFSASPSQFDLNSATVQIASSTLKLSAAVANYAAPVVTGSYEVLLHTQDAKKLGPSLIDPSLDVAGDVSLSGKLHYGDKANQSFLRNLDVEGQIASEVLSAVASGDRVELRKLRGRYQLSNGSLRANDVMADAYGGRISADLNMTNLDGNPAAQVKAEVRGLSLLAVQHSLSQARGQHVVVAGLVDGRAEATWTGTPRNATVRADLAVKSGAKGTPGNQTQILPVDGVIHAVYEGRSRVLTLANSTLRIPSATITADGQISNHSSLKIHANTEDLHSVMELASSFGTSSVHRVRRLRRCRAALRSTPRSLVQRRLQ